MAEEYFGSGAFAKTEVQVRQPPPVAVPMSMKAIRKQANRDRKEHRARMKEVRGRIRELNRGIRYARMGARLNRENAKFARAERRAIRKQAKHNRFVHSQVRRYQKHQLKLLRTRNAQLRERVRASRKALKEHKRAIAKMQPRAHQRAWRREQARGMKLAHFLHVTRLLKKLFKKTRADGRNHGFTKSGKHGLTGRAGFHR